MASNGPTSNGMRSMRSPPPPFRPPPPMAPPPVAPQSPMTQRKLSVNAPFRQSPGQSPNPPSGGFPPKRPIETIEPQKINRFGEAKLRSPARMLPPSNKVSMNNGKEEFLFKIIGTNGLVLSPLDKNTHIVRSFPEVARYLILYTSF